MKKIWLASVLFISSQAALAADFAKAEQLLNAGQANAALLETEAALASDPINPDGRFIQGIALAQLGRVEEAIIVFEDLTSDFREIPEPYNNLAVLLAQKGDYTGARNALEDAVKNHPKYTTAWENLADIYSVLATAAYEKVLEQDPDNRAAKHRLASMTNTLTLSPEPENSVQTEAATIETVAASTATEINDQPLATKSPTAKQANEAKPAPSTKATSPAANRATSNADQEAIMAHVNAWANAWSNQNIENYLSAYGSSYQPEGKLSRSEWESSRRKRLANPNNISVTLNEASVSLLDDNLAAVKFVQDYRSDYYQDMVNKTLVLERSNGNWRIIREQTIR